MSSDTRKAALFLLFVTTLLLAVFMKFYGLDINPGVAYAMGGLFIMAVSGVVDHDD